MNVREIEERAFRSPDGELKQHSDLLANRVERDLADLSDRNVIQATVDNFRSLITSFDDVPTDAELLGEVSISVDEKDALGNQLRNSIRTIRSMAQNKWGVKSARYHIFSFGEISKLPDYALHSLAKRVIRISKKQFDMVGGLTSEGLTQNNIDNLTALDVDFDNAIDAVDDAKYTRNEVTYERIQKGNVLYKEYARLCNIGKDVYKGINSVKYEGYLMGLSHVSPVQAGDKFGSLTLTITNEETEETIANVEIRLKGENLPDLVFQTNAEGKLTEDHVLAKYVTLEAIMMGFEPYSAPIEILPESELHLDIILVPLNPTA